MNDTNLVTKLVGVSPLAGILPLVYMVVVVIVVFAAISQLRSKGFTINKFVPWLLCAGLVGLMILNPFILAEIGATVWKITVSIVSGIKITQV